MRVPQKVDMQQDAEAWHKAQAQHQSQTVYALGRLFRKLKEDGIVIAPTWRAGARHALREAAWHSKAARAHDQVRALRAALRAERARVHQLEVAIATHCEAEPCGECEGCRFAETLG